MPPSAAAAGAVWANAVEINTADSTRRYGAPPINSGVQSLGLYAGSGSAGGQGLRPSPTRIRACRLPCESLCEQALRKRIYLKNGLVNRFSGSDLMWRRNRLPKGLYRLCPLHLRLL